MVFYAVENNQPSNFELLETATIRLANPLYSGINMLSAKVNNDAKQDLIISWPDANRDDKYQMFFGGDSGEYTASPIFDQPRGIPEFTSDTLSKKLLFNFKGGFNRTDISDDGVPSTTSSNIILDETGDAELLQSFDLNNDGLIDKVWINPSWNESRFTSVRNILSYSLQQDDNTFSTPTSISGEEVIVKVYYENTIESLIVIKRTLPLINEAGIASEDRDWIFEEYKLTAVGLTKLKTYQFGNNESMNFFASKAVDLDNDGVKELIGEKFDSSFNSDLVVWKRDTVNDTFSISQKIIGSDTEQQFLVSDMNSDGDKDIVLIGHNGEDEVSILYQNTQDLFDSADLISTDSISTGNVRDFFIFDHEYDNDSDIFVHAEKSQDIYLIKNKLH